MKKEGLPDLISDEMYQLIMKGWRKFYLRPSFALKRLTTPHNILFSIRNFPYFIKLYVIEPFKRKTQGE
jgi:hypothetical protein